MMVEKQAATGNSLDSEWYPPKSTLDLKSKTALGQMTLLQTCHFQAYKEEEHLCVLFVHISDYLLEISMYQTKSTFHLCRS